jgi:hypothetical protein
VSRATSTVLAAAAVCAFLLSWSLLHHGTLARAQITDTGVYSSYGDLMANGLVPYRDFTLEYPPGALPAFVGPSLVDRHHYVRWFDREMALCGCLMLIGAALCLHALGATLPRAAGALGLIAVSPLLLGSIVLTRFDLWPAALVALALAALLHERLATAAVLLGLAISAKFWPFVLVPLAVVWLVRTRGARAAALWSAGLAGVVLAVFLPVTVLAPRGVAHSIHAQVARPLQIESLGGAILIAVHHIANTSLHVTSTFGSQNLTGPGASAAAFLTSIAGVLALVAVWVLFARGPASNERFVVHAAGAVAVLVAFGKVFSPQFTIWLIPLVPLVRGLRGVMAAALLAMSLALTHAYFPLHYWALARGLAPQESWEVLARDLTVVGLAAVLVWPRLEHQMLGEHRARIEALERVRPQVE